MEEYGVPKCVMCGRERNVLDPEHKMDVYDYTPLQAITGAPFGWYSGSDGEICPEDMEKTIRGSGQQAERGRVD